MVGDGLFEAHIQQAFAFGKVAFALIVVFAAILLSLGVWVLVALIVWLMSK